MFINKVDIGSQIVCLIKLDQCTEFHITMYTIEVVICYSRQETCSPPGVFIVILSSTTHYWKTLCNRLAGVLYNHSRFLKLFSLSILLSTVGGCNLPVINNIIASKLSLITNNFKLMQKLRVQNDCNYNRLLIQQLLYEISLR